MNENRWKNAFGSPDPGFIRAVSDSIAACGVETAARCGRRVRMGLAAAAVMLLVFATAWAAANRWGLMDFLNGRGENHAVLPEADALVVRDPKQTGGETTMATFRLREAAYDGKRAYLVIEVKAKREDVLPLGMHTGPGDSVKQLGTDFRDREGTIEAYARGMGKEPVGTNVVERGAWDGGKFVGETGSSAMEADGTFVYYWEGSCPGGEARVPVEMDCWVAPFTREGDKWVPDATRLETTTLSFTLEADPEGIWQRASCEEGVDYADCGIRVDRVSLSASPMAVHARIEYTIVEEAAFAESTWMNTGLFLEIIGEDREADGPNGRVSQLPDEAGTGRRRYVQETQMPATREALPGSVTLRPMNHHDGRRFEAHAFTLR